MPGINGIQALKEIRGFNKTALLYIVSAYDKFDYAQEAMKLGAERYLMKPVARKTVIDTMQEAISKVEGMRQRRSHQLRVQEKLETIYPVVENGFVSNMLITSDWQDAQYFKQLLDITEDYGYVILFQFNTLLEDGLQASAVGASMQVQNFYPEFRAVVKSFVRCIIGSMISNRIVVVVPRSEDTLDYEQRIQVIDQARQIAARLDERLGVHFRAGIGRTRKLEDLKQSYQEAEQALRESDSRVVHTNDIIAHGVFEDDYPVDLEKEIFQLLTRGDLEGMQLQVNRFFDWMVRRYPGSRDTIRLKVLEFVLLAEKDAFYEGAVNYRFELRGNYLSEVMRFESYEDLRAWFISRLSDACSSIHDRKETQQETVVSKAKTYMQENFGKDISLDDVSREVNVSPYYFSKLFKEEAGENFIEYLTHLRIDRAKELLRDETLSIKEISMMIGYGDPNYFSRIFKKQTSMTPREYREG